MGFINPVSAQVDIGQYNQGIAVLSQFLQDHIQKKKKTVGLCTNPSIFSMTEEMNIKDYQYQVLVQK